MALALSRSPLCAPSKVPRSRWSTRVRDRAVRRVERDRRAARRLRANPAVAAGRDAIYWATVLPGITSEMRVEHSSVTSKGQVTIPKAVRQRLGIRRGSQIEFALVGDHVEMRVKSTPPDVPAGGFGMLVSRRPAVPADFDPADLLKP